MTAKQDQLVLYDLASKSNTPFSPSTLKTHYQLNYKGIPYTTQYLEFPEIAPLLTSFGIPSPPKNEGYGKHTVPAVKFPDGDCVMDSLAIYKRLETDAAYASLPKIPIDEALEQRVDAITTRMFIGLGPAFRYNTLMLFNPVGQEYYRKERMGGKELPKPTDGELNDAWVAAEGVVGELAAVLREGGSGGPFFLGDQVSWTDFRVVALFHFARKGSEETFERLMGIDPSLRGLYEACERWAPRA